MNSLNVYYDYTDPWSYIALFRVDWLRTQVPNLEVLWHPFEIYPDLPPRGARPQNPAFLRRKTQYDIDVAAGDLGVTIHVPSDRVTNSRLALEGGLYARDAGSFDRYHRAIFASFFEDRAPIGDVETVVAVGVSCGFAEDAFREALQSHRYTDEVVRLRAEAEEYGVVAVPTFVADNQGVVGIVAPDKLLDILTTRRYSVHE